MYNGSFDLSNESKPIRDIAYDRLKHAIITGELPAGSRIVETTYAEQLHISRTPLREALRRGVVVRAFTINDIEEIFTIRNAMMMLILPSVIKNVTDKDIAELRVLLSEMDVAQAEADCDALATFNRAFHSKIEHLSDKTRILRVIDDQEEYITRFAAITIASIVRRSNAHQEHHQMVDLLEKRDLPGMMKLMEHHLDESKQTCLEAVSNHKY